MSAGKRLLVMVIDDEPCKGDSDADHSENDTLSPMRMIPSLPSCFCLFVTETPLCPAPCRPRPSLVPVVFPPYLLFCFVLFFGPPGDPLMHKLAAVVAPMKSSFIVAHLRPREFVTQMQVRKSRLAVKSYEVLVAICQLFRERLRV